jgi:hypothetical protein
VTARPKRPGTPATPTEKSSVGAERIGPIGQRQPYQIAGEATRATLRAAMAADLAPLEHRVVEAAVVLIGTYSRTCDRIGTRQIAAEVYGIDRDDVAGWQRRRVSNALVALARAGVLEYGPGRGRGSRPTIALGGALAPPFGAVKVSSPDHLPGVKVSRQSTKSAVKVSRQSAKGVATGGPHREVFREERTTEKNSLRALSRTRGVKIIAADVEIVDADPSPNRRPPDPLFDAVTLELGIDPTALTRSARGALNRALAELRAVAADPAEVPARAAVYRARFDGAALTATALAKHWPALRPDAQNLPGNFGTLARVVAKRRAGR